MKKRKEEMIDDCSKEFDWGNYNLAVATQAIQSLLEAYTDHLFLRYTKFKLCQEELKRHIKIFPVYPPTDLIKGPQLRSKGFWIQAEYPELSETITYPRSFFKIFDCAPKTAFKPP